MCLSKLKSMDDIPEGRNHGSKIFYNDCGEVFPEIMRSKRIVECYTIPYPVDKWIEDLNDERLLSGSDKTYRCGFHIFLKYEDAVEWNGDSKSCGSSGRCYEVRKVEFDGAVAFGVQDGNKEVVVSRRIKILPR